MSDATQASFGRRRPYMALALVPRIGLVIGPLAAGVAIDIFGPVLEATDGYAALWPTVAIPVLAVIPIVALLADAERDRAGPLQAG